VAGKYHGAQYAKEFVCQGIEDNLTVFACGLFTVKILFCDAAILSRRTHPHSIFLVFFMYFVYFVVKYTSGE
jgi:hypothetical protein